MSDSAARAALDTALRESYARLIAGLARRVRGDIALAEDALGEASAEALAQWPSRGVPDSPAAWLASVAARRLLDGLRRRGAGREFTDAEMESLEAAGDGLGAARDARLDFGSDDDTLRLVFTCCHPSLAREARVALTLNVVSGLDAASIAHAYLVDDATMAKRLVRAKAKIRDAGIALSLPAPDELPGRLPDVLKVVELIFNEGYASARTTGDALTAPDLAEEALRLATEVARLAPAAPDAHALLALIELTHARRHARQDTDGALVRLPDQERSLWDDAAIARGKSALGRAVALGGESAFVLRAALAYEHSRASSASLTRWPRIVALYDVLLTLEPSPVIELNRAIAVGEVDGPEGGPEAMLQALGAIDDKGLWMSHYGWVAKGDALARLGRVREAQDAFHEALRRVRNEVERRHIEGMLDQS